MNGYNFTGFRLVALIVFCIIGLLFWPGADARPDDVPPPDGSPPKLTIVGTVHAGPVVITLYADKGFCIRDAQRATYLAPDKPLIPGCWALQPNGLVSSGFLDGAMAVFPIHAIKHPQPT